jgi:hypothetical protein
MSPDNNQSLEKRIIDGDEFKKFLLDNGVEGHFSTYISSIVHEGSTSQELKTFLDSKAKQYNFIIPPEPNLYLLFKIETYDLDCAFLFSSGFQEYLTVPNIDYNRITTIATGSSKIVPVPIISIYQTERFNLPALTHYEAGRIIAQSSPAGKEIYTPDYHLQDEEDYLDRFKRGLDKAICLSERKAIEGYLTNK